MNRSRKIVIPLIFLLVCSLFFISLTAKSEVGEIQPLAIRPILPDNQKNAQNSFFDLEVTPGLEQVLEIEFTNNTDSPMRFNTQAKTATTNSNGIIDYSQPTENNSMVFKFSDIVEIDTVIIIPPNEKKNVLATLTLPEDLFDGIVVGGLMFNLQNDDNEGGQNQINSKISYTIGVVLSQNDTPVLTKLDFYAVTVERINFRNYIQATIQNNKPVLMNNVNLVANVKNRDDDSVLYSIEKTDVRLAPNSNFTLQLDTTGDKPIEAGIYILDMTAIYGDEEWTWKEAFEVTDSTIKALDGTPNGETIRPNYLFHISIVLLLIIGGVILRKQSKKP